MAAPVYDSLVFDDALFGGAGELFDAAIFDVLVFETAAGSLLPRRALVRGGPWLAEITDGLLGTGKKPLVILGGELRERIAAEGVPVIVDAGALRCLDPATEQLLI